MKSYINICCLPVLFFIFVTGIAARNLTQDFTEPGSFEIDSLDLTWVDSSRNREIPVRLYIPVSQGADTTIWPVAVISHGGGESGRSMTYLGRHLASHGFLAACPTHRGSDRQWLNEALDRDVRLFSDIETTFGPRPGDISYILDNLLHESIWKAHIDSQKIAVLGHCMGASTAFAMAGLNVNMPGAPGQRFLDARISSVVALGPQIGQNRPFGLHPDSWSTVQTPALVVTGSDDFFWTQNAQENPAVIRVPYDSLNTPSCYAMLQGAEHNAFTDSDPYYPAGPRDPQHHAWINGLTLAFLQSTLMDDENAKSWLLRHQLAFEHPGAVTQEYEQFKLDIESTLLSITDSTRGVEFQARVTLPQVSGPYPLLLFSPYMRGTRDEYTPLVQFWAENGFVCIVPDHEGTPNRGLLSDEETLSTWRSRPQDLLAVLDALAQSEIASRIDMQRVGVGGHLFGAHAASLTAGCEVYSGGETVTFADERMDALLLMSPQGRGQGLTETSWLPIDVPLMVTTGTFDHSARTGNTSEWRTEPYQFSDGPQDWLAWIEGLRMDYDGLGQQEPLDTTGAIALDVLTLTTAFWRDQLYPDSAAARLLQPSAWTANPRIELNTKTGDERESDSLNYRTAADYSDQFGGAAMLVMQDGEIMFEHYAAGVHADTAIHIHSGTKSFWGPVAAAMIADGLIESFDELAAETIREWTLNPRKREITLRNILELNAGLAQDVVNLQGHDRPTLAPDLYVHAITVPMVDEPGEQFSYGPTCYYVLGEIFKRKLAENNGVPETPLDYLKRRILNPIGAEIGDWVHDESGNPHIPNGASISARDWARFGQFMLQKGEWNGEQLIPADLMRELLQPSEVNPGHGLAIWLNTPGGASYVGTQINLGSDPDDPGGFIYHNGEPDLFGAMGGGKNRMYMIPERSLVVVRQTFASNDGFEDSRFLQLLLEGEIATSVQDNPVNVIPDFRLGQNYPNPFNPHTRIEFKLPAAGHVNLTIYNVLGQRVTTLINKNLNAGSHRVTWDGRNAKGLPVGSGVYCYQLKAGNLIVSKKMLKLD